MAWRKKFVKNCKIIYENCLCRSLRKLQMKSMEVGLLRWDNTCQNRLYCCFHTGCYARKRVLELIYIDFHIHSNVYTCQALWKRSICDQNLEFWVYRLGLDERGQVRKGILLLQSRWEQARCVVSYLYMIMMKLFVFQLLAPQSGALRISAYRDFQSNPIPIHL